MYSVWTVPHRLHYLDRIWSLQIHSTPQYLCLPHPTQRMCWTFLSSNQPSSSALKQWRKNQIWFPSLQYSFLSRYYHLWLNQVAHFAILISCLNVMVANFKTILYVLKYKYRAYQCQNLSSEAFYIANSTRDHKVELVFFSWQLVPKDRKIWSIIAGVYVHAWTQGILWWLYL